MLFSPQWRPNLGRVDRPQSRMNSLQHIHAMRAELGGFVATSAVFWEESAAGNG